jgi:DNA-binding phage protein
MPKVTTRASAKDAPIDYLAVVRASLDIEPRPDFMRIAADSGLHLRTVYDVIDASKHPRYKTVFALYQTILGMGLVGKRRK